MSRQQASELGRVMARVEELAGAEGLKLMAKHDEALRGSINDLDELKTRKLIEFGKQLILVLADTHYTVSA
jgi:hypothetical protein